MREPPEPGVRTLPPLLIRADATPQMGTGHVMRCLALAQAWQDGGGLALLAAASLTPALEARLEGEGLVVERLAMEAGSEEDAAAVVSVARREGAGWVAVDGYGFSGEYQRAIAAAGHPLLAIDDYGHAAHYWASLLLNQNVDAREALYPCREPATRLLLGTGYALLRREFWPFRGCERRARETAHRVLVTMGGADPGNATLRVVAALRQVGLPGLEARVVVGGSNPNLPAVRDALGVAPDGATGTGLRPAPTDLGGASVELIVDTEEMPSLMAWADIAISAAGTTCWELAFLRVPALLLVLAENQRPNARELDRAGAAVSLGWHAEATPEAIAGALRSLLQDARTRHAMARAGGSLVDGRGAERAAHLLGRGAVRVRPAGQPDRGLLFEWANDPLTRRMSFRGQPIAWQEHVAWHRRVASDAETLLLIGEAWDAGRWVPCGQVRIDGEGTVSLAVAPRLRGRGLAGPLLRTALLAARARMPGCALVAFIKPENAASRQVFLNAGFAPAGEAEVLGQACGRYLYVG